MCVIGHLQFQTRLWPNIIILYDKVHFNRAKNGSYGNSLNKRYTYVQLLVWEFYTYFNIYVFLKRFFQDTSRKLWQQLRSRQQHDK